jgi:hypothetical protein
VGSVRTSDVVAHQMYTPSISGVTTSEFPTLPKYRKLKLRPSSNTRVLRRDQSPPQSQPAFLYDKFECCSAAEIIESDNEGVGVGPDACLRRRVPPWWRVRVNVSNHIERNVSKTASSPADGALQRLASTHTGTQADALATLRCGG